MWCEEVQDIFLRGRWLISNEHTMVNDVLQGYVKCNPNLAMLDFGRVVVRRNHLSMDKVKILSGGASGHEPAFAGFVGKGFLTAAVQGDIYCSPPPDTILKTIKELSRRNVHGTLIIIGNTLSDRLSFGLAMEKALTIPNLRVQMLLVEDEQRGALEKFGMVGTILVQKIAGAMSELGCFLDEIYDFCKSILPDILTTSVTLEWPQNPWAQIHTSTKYVNEQLVEFGTGFHGERGHLKLPLKSTFEIVKIMLEQVNIETHRTSLAFYEDDPPPIPIVLIINNKGSVSQFEEQIFVQEVISQLQMAQVKIVKIFIGAFFTSLRMAGFNLTIMKLTKPEVLNYITYPCGVPIWQEFVPLEFNTDLYLSTVFGKEELKLKERRGPELSDSVATVLKSVILFACEAVTSCERQLNIMDSEIGDADTGTNMKKVASSIAFQLSRTQNLTKPYELFKEISDALQLQSVGMSNCLYCIMFNKAAQVFMTKTELYPINGHLWVEVLKAATDGIKYYGKTKYGHKTMYDALYDFTTKFDRMLNDGAKDMDAFEHSLATVEEATRVMKPTEGTLPDPGAHAVTVWLRATYEALSVSKRVTEKKDIESVKISVTENLETQ